MQEEFAEELEDVSHLPLVQRMQHKQIGNKEKAWADCAVLLRDLPEGDPQFKEYSSLIKKTLKEKSPKSIMLALSCLEPLLRGCDLGEAEYNDLFNHICGTLLNHTNRAIASQCRENLNICIERDQNDNLVDACVKTATSSKVPKVHEVNLAFLVQALKDYGPGVINLRKVKPVLALVTSANGGVRAECRNLIMEIYRWVKDDLKPLLKDLPEKNLPKENEFEALKDERPEPTKFTRAVQKAREEAISSGVDPMAAVAATMTIESLVDPVDIFKRIPGLMKILQDKAELKNSLPKLRTELEENKVLVQNSSYDELIKFLLNIAVNEAKVMLSVEACKSLAQLAQKVPNAIAPHANKAIPELVKRAGFRQKALVDACCKALNAMVVVVKFEKLLELLSELVEDKKPDISMEASELIARAVLLCPVDDRPKKLPAGLVNALAKAFANSKPETRDAAMKATGALLRITNDRALQAQVDKLDASKRKKVDDYKDKCEVDGSSSSSAPVSNGSTPKPAVKKMAKVLSKESLASDISEPSAPNPPKRPAGRAPIKTSAKAAAKSTAAKKKGTSGPAKPAGKTTFTESALSDEDVVTQLEGVASDDIRNQMADSNWKTRLAACESLQKSVCSLADGTIPVQALARLITKKPGLKDSNFQVLKVKIEILADIFARGNVSLFTVDACKAELTEKLGDLKNSAVAAQALMSLAEATSLDLVSTQVLEAAFAQKSPKVQSEALNWTGQAIKDFGFKVPAKSVIVTMKTALAASNPAVRTAAVKLFGVMYLYLKAPLRGFFESEKPAVLALLDQEIASVQDQSAPVPIRGVKPQDRDDSPTDQDSQADEVEEVDASDLLPRSNIGNQLQGVLTELGDTNWKVRLKALTDIQGIISEANAITPDLGELPKALKARIGDTNKNLATQAIKICQSLIEAMGPNGHKHAQLFLPAIMAALADSKVQVRSAAISCLDKWFEICKDPMILFLDGDKLCDALKSDNPYLRSDLLEWFASKLDGFKGKINKEYLNTCIMPLFSCLEDRNPEVRKKAQACLIPLGNHTGFNALQSRCNSLPTSSKGAIAKHLEAVKGDLMKSQAPPPAQPVASSAKKGAAPTFTRRTSNVAKAREEEEERSPPKEDKRPGRKGEEELNPSLLFASRDLRQPATRKDPLMRWYIHDSKTVEKEKQELLAELKRMFECAGASNQCIQLSFSEMLPHHQKIADIWIQALRDEATQDMMLANRDLIIRWGAVHCYDKNWVTINHFMRFLLELFPVMLERGIVLETIEVNILLPNFFSKFVSMTAQSQELVDSVMRSLTMVCKPAQIFLNITDMLKNQKNYKLAKNMIEEMNKIMTDHRDEIRKLPNLRIVIRSLSEFTKQANMKEQCLRTIAELCFLKEGQKDQREMMREINDKDRATVEKYMTKIKEDRPSPVIQREATVVAEPASPAKFITRPSSMGNRTVTVTPAGNRTISTKNSALQFSPRTPPQMDLNVVNNNGDNAAAPMMSDPCGTFVRTATINRSPLGLSRTLRQPSATIKPASFDDENFQRISRLANLALKKEEITRTEKIPRFPASISTLPRGSLDEHFIARKLNCTAIEDVISAAEQIRASLANIEPTSTEINEAYVNSLFSNVGQQWNTVLTLYIPDDTSREEDIHDVIKSLGMCVYTIMTTGQLAKLASQSSLESLLPPGFQLLSHEFLEKFQKPGSSSSDVQKLLNDIIVKSLDKCNSTRITCALMRVYTDRVNRKLQELDENSRRCLDLMTKCVWKLVRHWKQHLPPDLEVLPVLRTGDHCLEVLASMQFVPCDIDKEFRTVRSVITELYNHFENQAMEQTLTHFQTESEVYKQIMKAKRNRERTLKQSFQEKDRKRLNGLVAKYRETEDLEELVIHVLVHDVQLDEILPLLQTADQRERMKMTFKELPNIRKEIESNGFPENFGYLPAEAITDIMKYLEKLWDIPDLTPPNMAQIIDDARNKPCEDISTEIRYHLDNSKKLLAELNES